MAGIDLCPSWFQLARIMDIMLASASVMLPPRNDKQEDESMLRTLMHKRCRKSLHPGQCC